MFISHHQIAGHTYNMKVTNKTLERWQSLNVWEWY